MAEAVILGSGTSNGVPSLGVDYPESFLANPKNHRTRPGLLLMGPGGNLLVDCPPEIRLQLLRERIKMIDAVLLTHTHADHIMGMDDLRAFCLLTKRPMPVYATPEHQADVRRIFNYAFADFLVGEVPKFDLRNAEASLHICGLNLLVFHLIHGPFDVLGFRVKDFAYVTDVSEIPAAAAAHLRDLDTLVLDAVRLKPHPNHFHFEKAIEVAREIGARKTYFTHLSHDYDHDKTNAELPHGIELAYDGLRIQI